MHSISRRIRRRRNARQFERALRDASPSLQQELYAMASRQNTRGF